MATNAGLVSQCILRRYPCLLHHSCKDHRSSKSFPTATPCRGDLVLPRGAVLRRITHSEHMLLSGMLFNIAEAFGCARTRPLGLEENCQEMSVWSRKDTQVGCTIFGENTPFLKIH